MRLFQPPDRPRQSIAAIKEIGLVDGAEIGVEMSDAGVVGALEVEDHGRACPLPDELVE